MKRLFALLALWLAWSSCAYGMERYSGYCERGGFAVAMQGMNSTTKVQRSFPSCTVTVYLADAQSLTITAISRTSNVVTATLSGAYPQYGAPASVIVTGVTDTSFNGTFTVASVTGSNEVTWAQAAVDASSVNGTASFFAKTYADNAGTPLANPFTAATDGFFFFYAPNGRYNLRYSNGTIPTPFTRGDYQLFDFTSGTVLGLQNINNIRYCDSFVGANAGEKIIACIADLPATGGIADARGFAGAQDIPSTVTISKPGVTLLLGSATFTLDSTSTGGTLASPNAGIRIDAENVNVYGNGASILQATRTWADGSWVGIGAFGVSGTEVRGIDLQVTAIGAMPGGAPARYISGINIRGDEADHDPASSNFRVENNKVWMRGAVTSEPFAKLSAIWIYSGHATLKANTFIVKGNILDDTHGRGIYLYRTEHGEIIGNTVTNLGKTLVGSFATSVGIRVIGSTAIAVAGNSISGTGSLGADLRGITVEGDTPNSNVAIVGNALNFTGDYVDLMGFNVSNSSHITITGNESIFEGTSNGYYGIRIGETASGDPDAHYVNVVGNEFRGWITAQIYIGGDNTEVDNVAVASNLIGNGVGGEIDPLAGVSSLTSYTNLRYSGNFEQTYAMPVSRTEPHWFVEGVLAGSNATKLSGRLARFVDTFTNPAATTIAADIRTVFQDTNAANAQSIYGASIVGQLGATSTQNFTGTLVGTYTGVQAAAGATGTLSNVHGVLVDSSNDGGTWTTYYGVRVNAPSGGGTITTKYPFYTPSNAGKSVFTDGVIIGAATNVYQGTQTTRNAVRTEVGTAGAVGSVYLSSAGKMYFKVAIAGADTDWERVNTSAAD